MYWKQTALIVTRLHLSFFVFCFLLNKLILIGHFFLLISGGELETYVKVIDFV